MCHTSSILNQQSEQIDKFVENGMPVKLVKKVNSIINRKRRLENRKNRLELSQDFAFENLEFSSNDSSLPSSEEDEILKFDFENTKQINAKVQEFTPTTKIQTINSFATKTITTSEENKEISETNKITSTPTPSTTQPIEITEATTTTTTTQATSAEIPNEVAVSPNHSITPAALPTPVRKVLTCPFTSNKRIVTVNPSQEANEKQRKLGEIAKFHFKKTTKFLMGEQSNSMSLEGAADLDVLGLSTQYSKQFFDYIGLLFQQFQTSRLYKFVTEKPQPFTVFGIAVMTYIIFAIGPDIHNNKKILNKNKNEFVNSRTYVQILATVLYLAAFATHFGAQIWMTFVSGLSLYFALPRHIFGQCQQILFPRFFLFNGIISTFMLLVYVKFFISSWTVTSGIQVAAMGASALIEFAVRLYFAPPMLLLMHEKYKIEDTVGSGQEVGMIVQGDLAQCPHYQRIHKAFRRSHMKIAICNMTVLMFTFIILFSLAAKIQIS